MRAVKNGSQIICWEPFFCRKRADQAAQRGGGPCRARVQPRSWMLGKGAGPEGYTRRRVVAMPMFGDKQGKRRPKRPHRRFVFARALRKRVLYRALRAVVPSKMPWKGLSSAG